MVKKKKNKVGKVVSVIVAILLIGAIGFGVIWSVINFESLKLALSGTKLYTATDIQTAYDDGYTTALDNKQEYELVISEYRENIAELNDTVAGLNDQITLLTEQKATLEDAAEVDQTTITGLNTQIETLNGQIEGLNDLIADLQVELQNTVDHYEQILSEIDFTNRATATFMLNGAEYATRSIELNAVGISITNPQSDDYDFLGWSINGTDVVDLSTYTITEDITFTAMLNHKYEVDFILEDEEYATQTVYENNYATATTPENVVYEVEWTPRGGYYGYDFIGWSIDGVNALDLTTYEITQDTTFTALVEYTVRTIFLYMHLDGTYPSFNGACTKIQHVGDIVDTSWFSPGRIAPLYGFSFTSGTGYNFVDLSNYHVTENNVIYAVVD